MKKSFTKIIIGVVFAVVMAAGLFVCILNAEKKETEAQNNSEIILDVPEDYVITGSVNIYVNHDNYLHTDETVIIGILDDIVYAGGKINRFIVAYGEEEYNILYRDLDLISTEILKTKDEDGKDEVKLFFRTGGSVTLSEGEQTKLYKNSEGRWTLDEREHETSHAEEFIGTVTDFEFLPNYEQTGDIYLSHITVENRDEETVNVYMYNMDTKAIKSNGQINVRYAGDIENNQVFDVQESDSFSVIIKTPSGDYAVKMGEEIMLKKNPDKGYWEITSKADTSRYLAQVESFEFGFTGEDISSLDYINFSIDGEQKVQLTMLQTLADYAVPHGNYKKIYIYSQHEKVLTQIEPMDDWTLELFYDDDITLQLSLGASVWIYKNENNIWVIDYLYAQQEEPDEVA